jgi:hypothetical protein
MPLKTETNHTRENNLRSFLNEATLTRKFRLGEIV